MAQRLEPIQSNFTGGELDPQLVAREDADIYYSGAERARNVLLIPHGGFTRRPGLVFRDELLSVIESIDLTAGGITVTAPEGGTAANAVDGDPSTRLTTTTAIGVVDPYVVLHVDMGAAFTDLVRFADVENLSTGTELVTSATVSFTAPSTITATGLLGGFTVGRRIQIKGTTDKANDDVFTIASVSANTITTVEATLVTQAAGPVVTLIERAAFLNFDEFRVQRSTDNAAWVDVESAYPFVTGEDNRWYYRRAPSVPTSYRYWRVVRIGATDGQDRVVELADFKLWRDTAALSNNKEIEFESSAIQTYTVLVTAFNARIYKDGIRQGDVSIGHNSDQLREVNWAQSLDSLFILHEEVQTRVVRRLSADDQWIARPQTFTSIPTRTFGDIQAAGVEDEEVWSATRGWPRTGAFFKGRVYLGGTRDLSSTYWASSVLDVFDFKPTDPAVEDGPFEVTLSESAAIYHLESSDFLFVITSGGAFIQQPRDDPPTFSNVAIGAVRGRKRARGPGFRAVQLDKGIVYLDDSGEQVNEIVEEVFRGSFEVNNLAFLAPHLIRNPVDLALRRSLSTDRGDLLLLVNSDGSLAVLQTLRDRAFSGWTGWHAGAAKADKLQGKFLSVGTQIGGINGRYFAVVERFIDGRLRRYYEEFSDTCLLDSSVIRVAQSTTVTATAGQAAFTYTFDSPPDLGDTPKAQLRPNRDGSLFKTSKFTPGTVFTISNAEIAAGGSANSKLLVVVSAEDSASGVEALSVTFAGVPLTRPANISLGPGFTNEVSVWALDMPTGMGDIVTTFALATDQAIITYMVGENLDLTKAVATATNSGPATASIQQDITIADAPALIVSGTSMGDLGTATPSGAAHLEVTEDEIATFPNSAQQIGQAFVTTGGPNTLGWDKDAGSWIRATLALCGFASIPFGDVADLTVRVNKVLIDPSRYTLDLVAKTVTLDTALAATVAAGDLVRIAENLQTITGLGHLEGETVKVRSNGAVRQDRVVIGGQIVIDELADQDVEIGLGFPDVKEILVNELRTRSVDPLTEEEARFEVFKVSDGTGAGDGVLVRDMPAALPPGGSVIALRGKKKRVHTAVVTVSNTQGFHFGANDEPTEAVVFDELGDFLLDRRPPLRSEQIRVHNLQGWTLDAQTEITQRDPIPCTVLSIVRQIVVAT